MNSTNTTNIWRASIGVARLSFEVLVLCLPALINRGPIPFADTRAYYLGGRAALDKILVVLLHEANDVDATVSKARGVRSAFYSLFIYILSNAGSIWLVILVQAIIVALMLRLSFALLCYRKPRWHTTLFIALLALTTTVPWVTSYLMPDVFTGVMILCIITIMLFWDRLSGAMHVALFIGVAASMVMHLTNLPIGIGILVTGYLLRRQWRPALSVGSALGFGVIAMLAVSVIGFKQWTLAPQAPPFLLARSIVDGPGRLYLQEHCPQIGLEICRHLDRLHPLSTDDFIWHENGVYSTVSPVEEAQLRKENWVFVAAALEHPWMQAKASVSNWVTQVSWFTLIDYHLPSHTAYTETDMTNSFDVGHDLHFLGWNILIYASVVVAVSYGALRFRTFGRDERGFFLLIVVGILLNSLIGAFSEPAPRYETRVIWLLPMTLLANRRLWS
jgi:hypothetical protein